MYQYFGCKMYYELVDFLNEQKIPKSNIVQILALPNGEFALIYISE